jgi:hypothetical protein
MYNERIIVRGKESIYFKGTRFECILIAEMDNYRFIMMGSFKYEVVSRSIPETG